MTKKASPLMNEVLLKISKIEEKQDSHFQLIQELSQLVQNFSQVIQELQASPAPKSKTSKNKRAKETKRVGVNLQIFAILVKYPDQSWTANELAAKIGCSGSAVKKTSTWKTYLKQKNETKLHSIRKGSKDKNGNITCDVDSNEIDD
jgi:hypothetical protein